MYYLRARYYQPDTGRFWTMDTFEGNNEDPLSLHKYLYVKNHPVNETDPSGHDGDLISFSVASSIGTSLHAMYDGVDLAAGSAMQHTIFGVQMNQSMTQVLMGYYEEMAVGVGIGLIAGKLLATLDEYMYGGGVFAGKAVGCFTGDTEISTDAGFKPINQIEVGDLVWSWNEDSKFAQLEKVVGTSTHIDQIVSLHVAGAEIKTTEEHPFWVVGAGWTRARDLKSGDHLFELNGETPDVESVDFSTNVTQVFNFEVESNHTYFVSTNGILVHNSCVWASRAATLPEESGIYIVELKGQVYVGKARNIRARLTGNHEHTAMIQHPDAQISVVKVDVSHLNNVTDQDRALKVIETDVINSMGAMKPKGLNGLIPLTKDKLELYRDTLKPVVTDYQEY
jgi:hypothetical protein